MEKPFLSQHGGVRSSTSSTKEDSSEKVTEVLLEPASNVSQGPVSPRGDAEAISATTQLDSSKAMSLKLAAEEQILQTTPILYTDESNTMLSPHKSTVAILAASDMKDGSPKKESLVPEIEDLSIQMSSSTSLSTEKLPALTSLSPGRYTSQSQSCSLDIQPDSPKNRKLKRKLPSEVFNKCKELADLGEELNQPLPAETASQTVFPSLLLLPVLPLPQPDSNSQQENISEPVKKIRVITTPMQLAPTTLTPSIAIEEIQRVLLTTTHPSSPPPPASTSASQAQENTSQQKFEVSEIPTSSQSISLLDLENASQQTLSIEIPQTSFPTIAPLTPENDSQSVFKIPPPRYPSSYRISQIPMPSIPQLGGFDRWPDRPQIPQMRELPRLLHGQSLLQPSLRIVLPNVQFHSPLPPVQPSVPSYLPQKKNEKEQQVHGDSITLLFSSPPPSPKSPSSYSPLTALSSLPSTSESTIESNDVITISYEDGQNFKISMSSSTNNETTLSTQHRLPGRTIEEITQDFLASSSTSTMQNLPPSKLLCESSHNIIIPASSTSEVTPDLQTLRSASCYDVASQTDSLPPVGSSYEVFTAASAPAPSTLVQSESFSFETPLYEDISPASSVDESAEFLTTSLSALNDASAPQQAETLRKISLLAFLNNSQPVDQNILLDQNMPLNLVRSVSSTLQPLHSTTTNDREVGIILSSTDDHTTPFTQHLLPEVDVPDLPSLRSASYCDVASQTDLNFTSLQLVSSHVQFSMNDVSTQTDLPYQIAQTGLHYTESFLIHDVSTQTNLHSKTVQSDLPHTVTYDVSTQRDSRPSENPAALVQPNSLLLKTFLYEHDRSSPLSTIETVQQRSSPSNEVISAASSFSSFIPQTENDPSPHASASEFLTTSLSNLAEPDASALEKLASEVFTPSVALLFPNHPSSQPDSSPLPSPLPPPATPPILSRISQLASFNIQQVDDGMELDEDMPLNPANFSRSPITSGSHCSRSAKPKRKRRQSRVESPINLYKIADRITRSVDPPHPSTFQPMQGGTSRRRRRSNLDRNLSQVGTLARTGILITINQPSRTKTISFQRPRSAHGLFQSVSQSQAETLFRWPEPAFLHSQVGFQPTIYPTRTGSLEQILHPPALQTSTTTNVARMSDGQDQRQRPLVFESSPAQHRSVQNRILSPLLSHTAMQPPLTSQRLQNYLDTLPPSPPPLDNLPRDLPILMYRYLHSLPDSFPPRPSTRPRSFNPRHSITSLHNKFARLSLSSEPRGSFGRQYIETERDRLPGYFESNYLDLSDGSSSEDLYEQQRNRNVLLYSRENVERFRRHLFLKVNGEFTCPVTRNSAQALRSYGFLLRFVVGYLVILCVFGHFGNFIAIWLQDLMSMWKWM